MFRLYRKVYVYTLVVLMGSFLLSFIAMQTVFDARQQNYVERLIRRDIGLVRRELRRTLEREPQALASRMDDLSSDLGWRLAYWDRFQHVHSSGIPKTPELTQARWAEIRRVGTLVTWRAPNPPEIWTLVGRRGQQVLWMQLDPAFLPRKFRGSLLPPLLFLFFLALLLIPLTRYLLRPYRELQVSIQRLATGDFSQPLDIARYRDFEGLASSFNHMSEQIQAMIQQKQRLIADVSHELRSPLTRLRVGLEMLLDRHPDSLRTIERGIHEIEELDRIIQDLLDISRLELDQLPMRLAHMDLVTLLQEQLERHRELLLRRELVILSDLPLSLELMGDRKRLGQVISNLLANLLKYVPAGTHADLRLTSDENWAVISLRDRGPGLPPDALDKIFEPFYRTDLSRSRKTGGTGLGLAIVKRMIEAHGGTVSASLPSDGEGGLCLTLRLPLQPKGF